MSNSFRYQPFLAISGNRGRKLVAVEDVLLSHEQGTCRTTSLDENWNDSEFQTDWNYYVDLRPTDLVLKLSWSKLVVTRHTKPMNLKKNRRKNQKTLQEMRKRRKKRGKTLQFPWFFEQKIIFLSFFSNLELFINNQQVYNSKGLQVLKSYIFNNLKGALLGDKVIFHCGRYDYEKCCDQVKDATLSEPFSKGEWECLVDPMVSCFMVNWGWNFSSLLKCCIQTWKVGYH